MSISAPYRFVPLSKAIVTPHWANEVSHDVPFEDGICGELDLEITAHTAICVGGEQDTASDREPGKVYFFRTPEGRPAIPGSSLKGMIRNILEIAGFGHFSAVQDQTLGVRDISTADNFYFKAIGKNTRAGWLQFKDDTWSIQPCTVSRIKQEDLIAACGIAKDVWVKLSKASERYNKIGLFKELNFDIEDLNNGNIRSLAKPNENGSNKGYVVVTGQPGGDFTRRNSKNKEFVFHTGESTAIAITPEVMSGFKQIHVETDEWKYWIGKLQEGNLKPGIPVFFNADKNGIVSLGLAYMYKLPYKLSLHQAIKNTNQNHIEGESLDLAQLLFGHIDDTGNSSLRGRVNIGLALESQAVGLPSFTKPTVLNGPKPGYYPTYIKQHDRKGTNFSQLMEPKAELSGWKRYPVKPFLIQPPPDKAGTKVQVQLETLSEGTSFTCKVRMHNLRFVELGALLWALTLPSTSKKTSLRHSLGMGKPYGLGQVSISVKNSILELNNPELLNDLEPVLLQQACIDEFTRYMSQALGEDWLNSSPMKALLSYLTPGEKSLLATPGEKSLLEYMPLKEFVSNKKDVENASDFHLEKGVDRDASNESFQANIKSAIERSVKVREIATQKEINEKLKSNASDEQKLLIEIKELLGSTLTATSEKNLERKLNEVYDTLVQFEGDDLKVLHELVGQADALGKKLISRVCKKIHST